jgi:hypothetical protein
MVTAPQTGTVLLCDYIVVQTASSVGVNTITTDATPTGAVDNSNTAFTTGQYIGGSLEVYINGVKQQRTTHFTEVSPASGTFTMSDAPLTGSNIQVNYQTNLASTGAADTLDAFHASQTPTANQILPLDANVRFPASVLGGAWATFTPVFPLISGGAAVWGNATFAGAYTQVGKTVFFRASVILGTTTNFTGLTAINFTLPVATIAAQVNHFIGQAFFMTGYQFGRVMCGSTTNCYIWCEQTGGAYNSASDITPTIPHAWASTHSITIHGSYEVA